MLCRVSLSLNGVRSISTVNAPSSIAALLLVLQSVPETAAVKAIVRVLKPMPEHPTVQ